MSLKQLLYQDMTKALKSRDALKLETIRYAIAEIKNFEIDHGEQDDAGIENLLRKQVKQMKESIEQFASGGRADLVSQENLKIKVLESYLPKQMDIAEVETVVKNVIANSTNPSFGSVMSETMKQLAGKADGAMVSQVVRQILQ